MKVDEILLSGFLSPALLGSHRASVVAGFLSRYRFVLSPKNYEVDGVITENKKKLLDESLRLCRLGKNLITVFSDRHDFAEVADQIAWGTKVWIANEPDHMIHYDDKPVMQTR